MSISLSGEFASSLSTVGLSSTDILLISEPALKNLKTDQYLSKHIDFETLSASILSNLKNIQHFGSMAFEEICDYSPIGHSHAFYNNVSVSALLSAELSTVFIGSLLVNGHKTMLYAPKTVVKQLPPPLVGQLKFVHNTTKRDIDIMSEDFDGWVYADGSSYECSLFKGSIEAFENDGYAFTVPNINSFMKPNPAPYASNDMSEKYNHVDPYHNHQLHVNLDGNVKGTLAYRYAKHGNGSASHGAEKGINTRTYSIELDYTNIRISAQSKDCIKAAKTIADETYPSHTVIPTMVYIGLPEPSNFKGAYA